MSSHLIEAHGGKLLNLVADPARSAELKKQNALTWTLTPRQACDLELMLNGGFSPLSGFMNKADYESVCKKMRLVDGTIWPIPVTLDVPEDFAQKLQKGTMVFLRDLEFVIIAVLHVEEVWKPDLMLEAEQVYGTKDTTHPAVSYLANKTKPCYVGGRIEGLQLPLHYDFSGLRHTPAELRSHFAKMGWSKVVAFQTRNPLHRAHLELTFRAAKQLEASLLIHPVVGMTKPGDVDHYTRVRCYQGVMKHYPQNTAMLSLLPLAMRMGGPREAILHAIIRKNYGCTHLIVGRDHAGPGSDKAGKPFYGPYDAQELMKKHEDELGIKMVQFSNMVYVEDRDEYMPDNEVPKDAKVKNLSGTELRNRLMDGREIPAWFSFPEVISELRKTHPPRAKQGFTVFFTGLPSSGKSTIANVLLVKLLEIGGRPVTILDGDVVRTHLSSELGFSKEHRDINIRRIGYVASEITKNGGIALCAPIAPYANVRADVRQMVQAGGGFILAHVSTPLEVCEQRDRKGLFAKARAGIVKEFTGISDPYEVPTDAELTLDTTEMSPEECVQKVILHLEKEGYIDAVR